MKIAILTSGILPVPAVQGGAVENLIDLYLEYNDQHHLHDITVYSVTHPDTRKHPALQSDINHYYFIEVQSQWAKIRKHIYKRIHGKEYYHYTIEYYLHEAIKHIRKQNYDIIILENRPGYALNLADETHAKLVYHLHNDLLNETTKDHQEVYHLASAIITVSDYITKRVKTIKPNDDKCITVYNGIDVQSFSNSQPATRETLGFTSNDFLISYSGRLIPEKGIIPLIKAMQQLKEHKDIKLMVLGGFSLGSNHIQTPFQQEIQDAVNGLDNILFTGYIPYNELRSYLKMVDIAVLPSIWDEPFGLTCIEAMAAGLPLITTRSGGIPEICEGVAMIVERENIISNLASAILDLYQHPEKRKQMSAAAVERSKLFDKERYARDFFKAIENP